MSGQRSMNRKPHVALWYAMNYLSDVDSFPPFVQQHQPCRRTFFEFNIYSNMADVKGLDTAEIVRSGTTYTANVGPKTFAFFKKLNQAAFFSIKVSKVFCLKISDTRKDFHFFILSTFFGSNFKAMPSLLQKKNSINQCKFIF